MIVDEMVALRVQRVVELWAEADFTACALRTEIASAIMATIEDRDRDWSHALKQAVESVFWQWSDFHGWPATPDVEVVCAWFKRLIEEYSRTKPHQFVGRSDRDCEVCGLPDRDEGHIFSRETYRRWLQLATKEECEACLMIAINVKDARKCLNQSEGEFAAFLIENLIRARFEKLT